MSSLRLKNPGPVTFFRTLYNHFVTFFRVLSLLSVTFFRIFYASSVTFFLKYKTAPTLNADAVIILSSFYSLSYRLIHFNAANGGNRLNLSLYALPDNELSLAEAVKCSCASRGIGAAAGNQQQIANLQRHG